MTRELQKVVVSPEVPGKGLLADAREIIESARTGAYRAVNAALVQRNWLLGQRIAEEELKGERAEYGRQVVKELAEQLTAEYGAGFDFGSLYKYVQFYRTFPILETLSPKSGGLLGWSHYLKLLQVENAEAREWYKEEAGAETWSVRTLQRNISSQYYERTLLSQSKDVVKAEMQRLTAPLQDRLEFIKNPVVAEFLGLAPRTDFTESDLETRILDNLGKFLMELGKGYSFVGRQQRIHTEKEDYFVDLVFYNYLLKCFVLIDLKTSKITHQDVGQMDMYVRMFDERRRGEGDNPTLGVILCADTDSDVARYSVLRGSEQLFATKYKLMLPSEEELRAEIEAQKAIFEAQHGEGSAPMCVREETEGWGKKATVSFVDGRVLVRLANGVAFSFSIVGNRRLEQATPEQLAHAEVDEVGLHWPEIDEDLSFAGLLRGDWGQHVRAPGEAVCVCEGGAPGNGKGETSDLARKGGEGV